MIIYSLSLDPSNEKTFVLKKRTKDLHESEVFDATGEKKANCWESPAVQWYTDRRRNLDKYKDPDISYIFGPPNLILSPRTANIMLPVVEGVAELLPVLFNDEVWYFMNVFNKIDAMDKANSHYKVYESGEVGHLVKPAFFPDKVPHAKLFMTPENRTRIYYAEHHTDDNPNTFKNVLEKNKLFGLQLKKVQEY